MDTHLHSPLHPAPRTSNDPTLLAECQDLENQIANLDAFTIANDAKFAAAYAESEEERLSAVRAYEDFYMPELDRLSAECQVKNKQILDRQRDLLTTEQTIQMLQSSLTSVNERSMSAASTLQREVVELQARLTAVRGTRVSKDAIHEEAMTELKNRQRELACLLDRRQETLPDMRLLEEKCLGILTLCKTFVTEHEQALGEVQASYETVTDEAVKQAARQDASRAKMAAKRVEMREAYQREMANLDERHDDLTARLANATQRISNLQSEIPIMVKDNQMELACLREKKLELLHQIQEVQRVIEAEATVIGQIETESQEGISHMRVGAQEYATRLQALQKGFSEDATSFLPSKVPTDLKQDPVDLCLTLQDKIEQAKGVLVRVHANLTDMKDKTKEARGALRQDKATACLNGTPDISMTPMKIMTPTKSVVNENDSPVRKVPPPKRGGSKAKTSGKK